jgi:Zn-finger nucleic acid-binding protein
MVKCAFCGESSVIANVTAEAQRSELACPRCGERLFSGAAHEISMLGCGLCGGIWLDNEAAQRVMAKFDEAIVDLAGRAAAHAQKHPDERAAVLCAACKQPMVRRRVGSVDLDLCTAHGTWFDAGELTAVVSMLRPLPPVEPAPAIYDAVSMTSSPGVDWGGVAGDVAAGAFGILIDVLTD